MSATGEQPSYATIELQRDGAIATLTLNRPEKMNSLSDQLLADFRAAMGQEFRRIAREQGLKAAIRWREQRFK